MKESFFILLIFFTSFISVEAKLALPLHVEQNFNETNIDKPIQLCFPSNHLSKKLLVLQESRILILSKDDGNKSEIVLLDRTDQDIIEKNFEEGLLGLALHSSFQGDRLFYVYHIIQNPKRGEVTELRTVIDGNALTLDRSYEREIIPIRRPYFGPDGYLYLSTGHEGKANAPNRFLQNTFTLLGTILGIDLDFKDSFLEYKIKPGYPFIEISGSREEVWGADLQNPWCLSWDYRETGRYSDSVLSIDGRSVTTPQFVFKENMIRVSPSLGQKSDRNIAPVKTSKLYKEMDGEFCVLGWRGLINQIL